MMVCIWREVYLSAWWVLNSVVGFEGREALSDFFFVCIIIIICSYRLSVNQGTNKEKIKIVIETL